MNSKPEWLKTRAPSTSEVEEEVGEILDELGLNTVCREADCPNQGECWGQGTATFMLLGRVCTRNCRFCDVEHGDPAGKVNSDEPGQLKEAVKQLGLDYVVLTSVDRDDLSDGGASIFEEAIKRIKELPGSPLVEGLIPDFSGRTEALKKITDSEVDVVGHNVETIRRLTPKVRDRRAGYEQSLSVLDQLKKINSDLVTKSSLMLGLGESKGEVIETMKDLHQVDVDIVTLGQYLRPTSEQLPVEKFWEISEFEELKRRGEKMGFSSVIAGPFVRSSYRARETYLRPKEE
ncbi:lipoyl synthase [Candidatus Bipolaricaulota bacterium]|nr:lipoyl synthase [Candidatus Bipolaricaulota bacterium]